MADEIHLRARGLHKAFRLGAAELEILRGVDLDVRRGEIVFLCGASGAGKSTLLVRLFGRALPADSALRARIGYLGHDAFLYRDLGARENLAYYGRLYGVSDAARAEKLLEEVGLAGVGTRRVAGYSRGMLQRLGLARSLMHRPDLLLLDEATVGLDIGSRESVLRIVRDLVSTRGLGVLWATHLMDEVRPSDHVVVLHKGRVLYDGSVPGFLSRTNAASVSAAFRAITGTSAEEAA